MNDKVYDGLKNAALIAAPVIVFLSTFLAIWNIPHQTEITATLAAIDTLLGAIVAILKDKYDKAGDK